MVSLDVSNAYYTIRVAEEYQKYLKFMWKGKLYKFCFLPIGLSPCLGRFTNLLTYPMGNLRELMHILSFYIDDIYLQGDSELKCIQNIALTITLLHELGFTLHTDKCQLIPVTKIKTFGFIVDSVEVKVTLTQDKTENILSLLKHNIRKNVIKIKELARTIGKLVATCPASKYDPLPYLFET